MLKNIVMFTLVSSFFAVQASDNESERSSLGGIPYFDEAYDSDDGYASVRLPRAAVPITPAINYAVTTTSRTLTAEQLQAIRERQMATLASEPKKTAIGTASTFHCQLAQQSIYEGKVYKKIPFDEFAQQYSDKVEEFTERVKEESALDEYFTDELYDNITANPGQKEFSTYKIIGEMPSTDGFREGLFDIDFAREHLQKLIEGYIDRNHAQVREKCLGKGLATTISEEVWSPCVCKVQLHRSCFKQCYHNRVASCVNPYCQTLQDGSSYARNWTPVLYTKAFKNRPVVPVSKIQDQNCPACYEKLLPPSTVAIMAGAAARDLRSKVKKAAVSTAVDEESTTSSSTHKKKRRRNKSHRQSIEALEEL